jgi:RNA polymerase sigma-70 factor (ECF subfamily)
MTGSPIVEMNRAIAVAEFEGPAAALEILDRLPLEEYRYYHSTRADLLRRLGRTAEARTAYSRAFALSEESPERDFLRHRLAELHPRTRDEWEEFWTHVLDDLKETIESRAKPDS